MVQYAQRSELIQVHRPSLTNLTHFSQKKQFFSLALCTEQTLWDCIVRTLSLYFCQCSIFAVKQHSCVIYDALQQMFYL